MEGAYVLVLHDTPTVQDELRFILFDKEEEDRRGARRSVLGKIRLVKTKLKKVSNKKIIKLSSANSKQEV